LTQVVNVQLKFSLSEQTYMQDGWLSFSSAA